MATVNNQPKNEANHPQDELKTALNDFEACLLAPMVSGELVSWLEAVEKSWAELSAQVHFHVKHLHPRQYDEIANQGPDLLPRIDQLRADDGAIEQQRSELSQSINRISQHLPKLEPDEEKAHKHLQHLVDAGVAFLTSIRKLEITVQTWYIEAFNRDHGAGD